MIGMDRFRDGRILRPRGSIRKRLFDMDRLGDKCLSRCDNKCFHTKAAGKVTYSPALVISLDVALVPGQPKGGIGYLDKKEVIVGLGPQAEDFHMEIFHWTDVSDRNPPVSVRQTGGG